MFISNLNRDAIKNRNISVLEIGICLFLHSHGKYVRKKSLFIVA